LFAFELKCLIEVQRIVVDHLPTLFAILFIIGNIQEQAREEKDKSLADPGGIIHHPMGMD